MMATDIDGLTLREYQIAMMESLGFTWSQSVDLCDAQRLVTARNSLGVARSYDLRVDHHYVRHMLDNGATHDQVLAILI